MPTCYVVQESSGKNLLPARDHGEIIVMLTDSDVRKGMPHCVAALKEKLRDFDCGQDFLILLGDPIYMGIAMTLVAIVSEDFQVLRWDREHYRYDPIDIRL